LRAAGLRPIEVWSAPEDHARIREFVRDINMTSILSNAAKSIKAEIVEMIRQGVMPPEE
jgi:vacuolar-type H+-ATPase subunit F/Vma7